MLPVGGAIVTRERELRDEESVLAESTPPGQDARLTIATAGGAEPKIRLEKEPQGRLRWLTMEEATRLLAKC